MRTVILLLAACLVVLPSSYGQLIKSKHVMRRPPVRCMIYCPYGDDPNKACGCLPPPRRDLCLNKKCATGKQCVIRRGTARCISNPVSPIFRRSVCRLPRVVGRCRAAIRRYYFDKESGRCQEFIYGGCGGNQNNFYSLSECQQQCGEPVDPWIDPWFRHAKRND